jgi:hypothetical protein
MQLTKQQRETFHAMGSIVYQRAARFLGQIHDIDSDLHNPISSDVLQVHLGELREEAFKLADLLGDMQDIARVSSQAGDSSQQTVKATARPVNTV